MKFLSYKILSVDSDSLTFEAVFDTEKKTKKISYVEFGRDEILKDENGNEVLDRSGNPRTVIVKEYPYDPASVESIDKAIKRWADAYVWGKNIESSKQKEVSSDVKSLVGKVVKVEAVAVDPA